MTWELQGCCRAEHGGAHWCTLVHVAEVPAKLRSSGPVDGAELLLAWRLGAARVVWYIFNNADDDLNTQSYLLYICFLVLQKICCGEQLDGVALRLP